MHDSTYISLYLDICTNFYPLAHYCINCEIYKFSTCHAHASELYIRRNNRGYPTKLKCNNNNVILLSDKSYMQEIHLFNISFKWIARGIQK